MSIIHSGSVRCAALVFACASGEKTNPVNGRFLAREALERMLAGTQLVASQDQATGAFIEDRGSINLTEATRYVPSLRRGTNNNEAFTLRGFNTDVPRRNYFSNVGAGRSRTENAEIERIEVVKGPTSVLFGFGGPGGVINVLTKKPMAKPAYAFSAEYGSFDHRRLTADATGPLLTRGESQVRYRVMGTRQRSKGYRDFERYDQSFLNTQLPDFLNTILTGNKLFAGVGRMESEDYIGVALHRGAPFTAKLSALVRF